MIILIFGGNPRKMEIIPLRPTGFCSNSFILHNGKEALAVDPSMPHEMYLSMLSSNGLTLKGILLTHGHFDHIYRSDELKKATHSPVYIHELDAELLGDSRKNAYSHFFEGALTVSAANIFLKEGDTVMLGDEGIKVIHTPGHTRGSVCYDAGDFMLTGDTLFAGGYGRYDLYGGDLRALKASLSRLASLAKTDNKPIYCGHGESSTLKRATDCIKQFSDI